MIINIRLEKDSNTFDRDINADTDSILKNIHSNINVKYIDLDISEL